MVAIFVPFFAFSKVFISSELEFITLEVEVSECPE